IRGTPTTDVFPYTTLFRSISPRHLHHHVIRLPGVVDGRIDERDLVPRDELALSGKDDCNRSTGLGAKPEHGRHSREGTPHGRHRDRKSTRLNSSHVEISYA